MLSEITVGYLPLNMSSAQLFDFALIGFGGVFCLVWGIGLTLRPPGRSVPVAGTAFVLISGVRLTWEAWCLSGLVALAPAWFVAPVPLLYAIGPILYFYYSRIGVSSQEQRRPGWWHWLLPILAVLPVPAWLAVSAPEQIELLHRLPVSVPVERSSADWLLLLWVIGPKLSILAYALWIPLRRQAEGVNAADALDFELRWFARILLAYVWLMIVADITGYLFGVPFLFRSSAWSHAVVAVLVFWFSGRRPAALLEFEQALAKTRYARSKLSGVRVDAVLDELDRLMIEEKHYADEDLRLARLAEACGLSAHQLSELLNDHLQLNFAGFVNRHRSHAAATMLREEPERTVLSVAMAVGFQSKSAFHRAFREEFGVTPQAYRRSGGAGL